MNQAADPVVADRQLSAVQQNGMLDVLTNFAGQGIGLVTLRDRPERTMFLEHLADVFRRARWRVCPLEPIDERGFHFESFAADGAGLFVLRYQQDYPEPVKTALESSLAAVRAALAAADIPYRMINATDYRDLYSNDVHTGVPIIFVGAKTPPPLKH